MGRTESARHAEGRGFIRGAPPARTLATRTVLWLACAALLVGVVISQLGENGLIAWRRLHDQEEHLRTEVATLAADSRHLDAKIDALANDPTALEKLAREEYGMKEPGEAVLLVIPAGRGPSE